MNRIIYASVFALLLGAGIAPVSAQSSDDLVRSLQQSQTRMRGFNASADNPEAAQDRAFIDSLRGETRSIGVEQRNEIVKVIEKNALPSVDIEIFFDFNSAAIAPGAVQSVTALGQALSDPRLKGSSFLIGGHTDGRGSNAANQVLSERRAASVKTFLVEIFGIDAKSLIVSGFGEEKLKVASNPEAGENRRVQVVNLSGIAQAGNNPIVNPKPEEIR